MDRCLRINQGDIRFARLERCSFGWCGVMIETRHGTFGLWFIIEDEDGNVELVLCDEVDR